MSVLRSLDIQRAVFLARSALRSTQEVQLFGNLLCAVEDERDSCLDRLDGCDVRGLACPTGSDNNWAYHFLEESRSGFSWRAIILAYSS